MGDDSAARLAADVERRVHLEETVRLPQAMRQQATMALLDGSSFIRDGDPAMYAVAADFAERGYLWACETGLKALVPSGPTREAITIMTEGFNLETGDLAWANVALACRNAKLIYRGDDETSLEDELARQYEVVAPDERIRTEAISDAFQAGALIRAAEREIVVELDWAERKAALKRLQKWDWLRPRNILWRWRRRHSASAGV